MDWRVCGGKTAFKKHGFLTAKGPSQHLKLRLEANELPNGCVFQTASKGSPMRCGSPA